jgi:hypothetical protein
VMSVNALKRQAYHIAATSTSAATSLCARLTLEEPTEKTSIAIVDSQGESEARTTPRLVDLEGDHTHSSPSSGVSQDWFTAVMLCA